MKVIYQLEENRNRKKKLDILKYIYNFFEKKYFYPFVQKDLQIRTRAEDIIVIQIGIVIHPSTLSDGLGRGTPPVQKFGPFLKLGAIKSPLRPLPLSLSSKSSSAPTEILAACSESNFSSQDFQGFTTSQNSQNLSLVLSI